MAHIIGRYNICVSISSCIQSKNAPNPKPNDSNISWIRCVEKRSTFCPIHDHTACIQTRKYPPRTNKNVVFRRNINTPPAPTSPHFWLTWKKLNTSKPRNSITTVCKSFGFVVNKRYNTGIAHETIAAISIFRDFAVASISK